MNCHLQITKSVFKLRFIIVFLIVLHICPIVGYTQDKGVTSLPLDLNDTLKFNKNEKGLFKKLIQGIKFKENRNNKEKERIYKFMLQLVNSRDLSIDSNINEITRILDSINVVDSVKTNGIYQKILSNKLTIDSLKINTTDSNTIDSNVIDSLELVFKTKLDTILENRLDTYFIKQSIIDNASETRLKDLRLTTCSCKWRDEQPNEIKDSILTCLKPKVKIIGWHNYWNTKNGEYKNYNYHYLSAINLYDYYELSSNGTPKKPERLEGLERQGSTSIINLAKSKSTAVYLTIHNKYPNEISEFLNDIEAQDLLINYLEPLVDSNIIQGINLYFENIPISKNREKQNDTKFYNFIENLRREFKALNISITIPSIYENSSLEHVKAYNFSILEPLVDDFLVSTDLMTGYNNNWAQPTSPLNSAEKPEFGTIASTVNFYINKIPVNKLIVSVSYLGLKWHVDSDFNGKANNGATNMKYSSILKTIKNNKQLKENIEFGYDSIQKSAYINWTNKLYNSSRYYQIWYENEQSLKDKYQWIIEKGIAGVSIRGLGYDDGYTGLWDVLGTNLIEIEDFKLEPIKELKLCKFDSIQKSAFNTNLFKEGRWANFDSIQKKNSQSIWYRFQWNIPKDSIISKIKTNTFLTALNSDYLWAQENNTYYITDTGKSIPNPNGTYLNDIETCICIYERLIITSKIGFYGAGLCILIILCFILRLNYLDRFNKGGLIERLIIKIISFIFGFIAIILLFYGLYMTPYFVEFGASNQGEFSIHWIFYIMLFGVMLGLFIHYRYFKGKYLHKNLP